MEEQEKSGAWQVVVAGLVFTALVVFAVLMVRKKPPGEAVAPAASVTASASVTIEIVPEPPRSAAKITSLAAEPVTYLPATRTFYRSWSGTRAVVDSREAAKSEKREWVLPYPFELRITTEDNPSFEHCGFFPALHGDGWRTSWCKIGTDLVPHRLYIKRRWQNKRSEWLYDFEMTTEYDNDNDTGNELDSLIRTHTGFSEMPDDK